MSIKPLPLSGNVQPRTPNQALYVDAINSSIITLCVGKAGTGKTFLACYQAAKALKERRFKKIIITRPTVSCGDDMGYFPGDPTEKVAPYMQPMLDAFKEFFDPDEFRKFLDQKIIEMVPLQLMRGSSYKNTFLICDEAQNAKYTQLHMLLTRFGTGSKVVVCGDASQSDLQGETKNPLILIRDRFAPECHRDVKITYLTKEDIVRHPLIVWVESRLDDDFDEDNIPPATDESHSAIWYDKPKEGDFLDDWIQEQCPCCYSNFVYDNGKPLGLEVPDVEQVQCWDCGVYLDLRDGMILETKNRIPNCAETHENVPD